MARRLVTARELERERHRTVEVTARKLEGSELEQWWPKMMEVWPAFADHYANTGERTIFSLEPATTDEKPG